jgi:peptidoglycan/LPS O-acetylase OafA/YrhL
MLGQKAGDLEQVYKPNAGPEWFIFWLLALDWAYSTVHAVLKSDNYAPEERVIRKMPGTAARMGAGLVFCGAFSSMVFYLLQQNSKNYNLAGMPIAIGSLPCNIFMYMLGIYARHNKWLESNVRDQMDIPVWLLRTIVVLEYGVLVAMVHLILNEPQGPNANYYRAVYFVMAGVYCVDACLATIDIFQVNMNFENKVSRFMSDSAYTVYLTHVVFVVAFTAVFVNLYESWSDTTLQFYPVPGGFTFSPSPLKGGKDGATALGLGFLFTCIVVHATVWPAAWLIRQLPGLKGVL